MTVSRNTWSFLFLLLGLVLLLVGFLGGIKAGGEGFASRFVITAGITGLACIVVWVLGQIAGAIILGVGILMGCLFFLGLLGLWSEAPLLLKIWEIYMSGGSISDFFMVLGIPFLIWLGYSLSLSQEGVETQLKKSAARAKRDRDARIVKCARCSWKGSLGTWSTFGICPTCGHGQYKF